MKERLFLIIQKWFFQERNIKNIFMLVLIFFILISILLRKKITIDILLCMVNSDMFNVSGILAGFVFTGLGFITVSDSKMIKDLKTTGNFEVIKNFYVHSIYSYVSVMLLYLLKPIVIGDMSLIADGTVISIIIKIYLMLIIMLFIFACILFLFCLFILNKRISE